MFYFSFNTLSNIIICGFYSILLILKEALSCIMNDKYKRSEPIQETYGIFWLCEGNVTGEHLAFKQSANNVITENELYFFRKIKHPNH